MNKKYYSHLCKCGCENKIEIKLRHKYDGIPVYILGHTWKNKKRPDMSGDKNPTKRPEVRKKMSEAGINVPKSEEHKRKIGIANKGNKRQDLSQYNKRRKITGEFKKEKHPNWKNGATYNREEILKILGVKCNRCIVNIKKILVCHHKDRNRKNNNIDNFEILCLNCHTLEHSKDKKKNSKEK